MSEVPREYLDAFDLAIRRNDTVEDAAILEGYGTLGFILERSRALVWNHNLHYALAATVLSNGIEYYRPDFWADNVTTHLSTSLVELAQIGERAMLSNREIYLRNQWWQFPSSYDLDALVESFHYGASQSENHTHPAYAVTGISTAVKHMVPVINNARFGCDLDEELAKQAFINSFRPKKHDNRFPANGILYEFMTLGAGGAALELDSILLPPGPLFKFDYLPGIAEVQKHPIPLVYFTLEPEYRKVLTQLKQLAHQYTQQNKRMFLGDEAQDLPEYAGHTPLCPAGFIIDGEIIAVRLAQLLADSIPSGYWQADTVLV